MNGDIMVVDFHTHMLPEIDDGSQSVEESLAMLALSVEQGVDVIALTPHFDLAYEDVDCFLDRRAVAFEKLQQGIAQAGILNPPKFLLGAEVVFYPELYNMEDVVKLSLQGTEYIMIEMPFNDWANHTYNTLSYIRNRNLTPLIAHVERFVPLQSRFSKIRKLADLDVVIQLGTDCFEDFYSRRMAFKLLRKGLAHILGSDCHNMTHRKPNMQQAMNWIGKKMGPEKLREIERASRFVLGEVEE